ncbi:MAG TPA: hypothetical protein VFK84_04850 [Burkholderiales bacterium]|nr:hypothetical protein [Burkholderiales bacterium]
MGAPDVNPHDRDDQDPDATVGEGEALELYAGQLQRQRVAETELLRLLTDQIRLYEGCEEVAVIEVTRLPAPDETGCNWSSAIVLDAAGVHPTVYSLAYAAVIAQARAMWNLE